MRCVWGGPESIFEVSSRLKSATQLGIYFSMNAHKAIIFIFVVNVFFYTLIFECVLEWGMSIHQPSVSPFLLFYSMILFPLKRRAHYYLVSTHYLHMMFLGNTIFIITFNHFHSGASSHVWVGWKCGSRCYRTISYIHYALVDERLYYFLISCFYIISRTNFS